MEPSVGKPYLFVPIAKDIWEAMRETYSDVENFSQTFKLKNRLRKSRQGGCEVTDFFNEMMSLWQELDLCYNDEWDCPSVRYMKKEENGQVYLFIGWGKQRF